MSLTTTKTTTAQSLSSSENIRTVAEVAERPNALTFLQTNIDRR